MKTLLAIFAIFVCVMIIGVVEDPCTTEGLAPGCIEKINH